MVIHGKRSRRRVHDGQMAGQHLVVGDGVVFDGAGILGGVGGVNAVDILCQQDRVGVNFRCAQHRAGVR